MTVKDLIEQLQTFPPDMEVYIIWDEAGTFHEKTSPPQIFNIAKYDKRKSYLGCDQLVEKCDKIWGIPKEEKTVLVV